MHTQAWRSCVGLPGEHEHRALWRIHLHAAGSAGVGLLLSEVLGRLVHTTVPAKLGIIARQLHDVAAGQTATAASTKATNATH